MLPMNDEQVVKNVKRFNPHIHSGKADSLLSMASSSGEARVALARKVNEK